MTGTNSRNGIFQDADEEKLSRFVDKVWHRGQELYRDLPWRNISDPYAVMLSEVMLQQTQVSRVLGRWEQWLETFPTISSLAAAPLPPVLEMWQGMGYNRRALNLKKCAEVVADEYDGEMPRGHKELVSLPGIGPATAAGIRAFAFLEPDVYLETNVRTVFLHEFFEGQDGVSDKQIAPLVAAACPQAGPDVRAWYYALLDYGAHLKKVLPNPSRRSKHHVKQSRFEGSHRQKRAFLLRRVLEGPAGVDELSADLAVHEKSAGRDGVSDEEVAAILSELENEGFVMHEGDLWSCKE